MASDVMAWRYLDQISPIMLLRFSPPIFKHHMGCGGPWFGYENFLSQKPSKGKTVAKGQIAGWDISYFTNLYFECICSWKILYNKYLKGSSLSISNPMWNSNFALTKPLKCCSESLLSLILNPTIYPRLNRINSLQTLTNCFFLGSWLILSVTTRKTVLFIKPRCRRSPAIRSEMIHPQGLRGSARWMFPPYIEDKRLSSVFWADG